MDTPNTIVFFVCGTVVTGKSIIDEKNGQCVIRISLDPGTSNKNNPALIDKSDVLLPPLHIKLGLMKQMVKAMDKTLPAFNKKIKEGIFV